MWKHCKRFNRLQRHDYTTNETLDLDYHCLSPELTHHLFVLCNCVYDLWTNRLLLKYFQILLKTKFINFWQKENNYPILRVKSLFKKVLKFPKNIFLLILTFVWFTARSEVPPRSFSEMFGPNRWIKYFEVSISLL